MIIGIGAQVQGTTPPALPNNNSPPTASAIAPAPRVHAGRPCRPPGGRGGGTPGRRPAPQAPPAPRRSPRRPPELGLLAVMGRGAARPSRLQLWRLAARSAQRPCQGSARNPPKAEGHLLRLKTIFKSRNPVRSECLSVQHVSSTSNAGNIMQKKRRTCCSSISAPFHWLKRPVITACSSAQNTCIGLSSVRTRGQEICVSHLPHAL